MKTTLENLSNLSFLAAGIRDQALCARTGTCVGICPEGAISLDVNYYPVLNSNACTQCGKCGDVCPGGRVRFKDLSHQVFGVPDDESFDGHILNTYIGYSADTTVRRDGAGGGLITALAMGLLAQGEIDGCVVTRMRSDKPWKGEAFIARNHEELASSQGSRYTMIPLNCTLKEILDKPGRYAVIGLPCHLHGIREAMRINPVLEKRIVAVLGTFCGGALELTLIPELLQAKGISVDSICNFEFRGGQWPGQMRAVFPDKKPQPVHYSNYKDGAYNYLISLYMPPRCQVCLDGSNLFADISVGDAWTRAKDGRYKFRNQSQVFVRSKRGQALIQQVMASGAVVLKDVSVDPSYHTHKIRTKRKGINAPLRHARWGKKRLPVPEYDRQPPDATRKERLVEQLTSFFLWLGGYRGLRYPLLKLFTSRIAVPLIYIRLWFKERKYRRQSR